MNIALWIVQIAVAGIFAFSGSRKLLSPEISDGVLAGTAPAIIIMIGVLEIMASMGLVLPQLTKILPKLTPLAAAGSVLLMIGAVAAQIMNGTSPLTPAIVLLLALFVAYGRFVLAPPE